MGIFTNIGNGLDKLLFKQEVTADIQPKNKAADVGGGANAVDLIPDENDNAGWIKKGLTDELLNALGQCGNLYEQDDPRSFLNYSNLIYKVMPLYRRAIQIRSIFLGTVDIEVKSKNKSIKQLAKKILKKIPIYDSNTLIPKGYGLNSLLNMISEDCDKWGQSFVQVIAGPDEQVESFRIYYPKNFTFKLDDKGVKRLYFDGNKVVDISTIYIFSYQGVRGYDWGCPLIYGNKFMGDGIVKLINAEMNGLMRNMNPYDVTIISTDPKQMEDLPEKHQTNIKNAIIRLKQDVLKASEKSLKGESVNLFTNIPALSKFYTTKGASEITLIDSQSLLLLLDLFCSGLNVPFQLLMDTAGSMNTDKYKSALLMAEALASEFQRPQIQPILEKMVTDIYFRSGFPINDELELVFKVNETLLSGIGATPPAVK